MCIKQQTITYKMIWKWYMILYHIIILTIWYKCKWYDYDMILYQKINDISKVCQLVLESTNWYFKKYQSALEVPIPIGIWSINCYLKYQLVFEIPISFKRASIWDSILQIGIWDTKKVFIKVVGTSFTEITGTGSLFSLVLVIISSEIFPFLKHNFFQKRKFQFFYLPARRALMVYILLCCSSCSCSSCC
jgi:Na+-translocating ferredoxin:NAD+ oxidoreductase RnfE subunit